MSTWNHRVIKHDADNDEVYYALHETHYNDDGKPEATTTFPTAVQGDSVEDLRWTLEQMLKALDQPVLNYKDF